MSQLPQIDLSEHEDVQSLLNEVMHQIDRPHTQILAFTNLHLFPPVKTDDRNDVQRHFGALAALGSVINFSPLPLIGTVNGELSVDGLFLSSLCDRVLVSTDAAIRIEPTALSGLTAVALSHRMGPERSREILESGESISYLTALNWGLFSTVANMKSLSDLTYTVTEGLLSDDSLTTDSSASDAMSTTEFADCLEGAIETMVDIHQARSVVDLSDMFPELARPTVSAPHEASQQVQSSD